MQARGAKMATAKITLNGTELEVQLPIAMNTDRITGDDGRDLSGTLQLSHRAFKRQWTLEKGLADQTEMEIWETEALNVQPVTFTDERGREYTVVTREWRPELVLSLSSTTSRWRVRILIEEE